MSRRTVPDLRLDDHPVRLSVLPQTGGPAAPPGVVLDAYPWNLEEILAEQGRAWISGPRNGLRVTGVNDLRFLAELPDLLYLEIDTVDPVDPAPLAGLRNLRGLMLGEPSGGLDFGWFPRLESYAGKWHRGHRRAGDARELRVLRLWSFHPASGDVRDLSGCSRLTSLQVVRTHVKSLEGLAALEDLGSLDVARAPKLEDLGALASGGCPLRSVSLSHVKSVRSYEPLGGLAHLKRLTITDGAPIADLQWIRALQRLEHVALVGTRVLDDDLTPLLELPRLRHVGLEAARCSGDSARAVLDWVRRRRGED